MDRSALDACALCGGTARLARETRVVVIGAREACVPEEFWRCDECGEIRMTAEQMRTGQERAVRAIRLREGLLQGEEIRAFRHSLGLTQSGFETLLGVGPKTVVRWEKGMVFQARAVDTLLRVLKAHPAAVSELARSRGLQIDATAADA